MTISSLNIENYRPTLDVDGNIYVSDTNLLAIWKVTPEGRATILVQDDALLWTDLMWVSADKKLWLPASQMRPGSDGLWLMVPTTSLLIPLMRVLLPLIMPKWTHVQFINFVRLCVG